MTLSSVQKSELKKKFCPARSQPDDFEPPFTGYFSRPKTVSLYTTAMVGIQSGSDGAGSALLFELLGLMGGRGQYRPLLVETSWHIDADGYRNDIAMPYWRKPEEMYGFFDREDVVAWRSEVQHGDVGWWRESVIAPMSALDGGYSVREPGYGVSRYSEIEIEQFHGYMGSMRDRTPDYLSGRADGPDGRLERIAGVDSRGKHLIVDDLPENLCFIRGAWGWMRADSDEQQAFQEQMLPVLTEGSVYLRDNPEESGCVSMRQTRATHVGYDNNVEVEILGWFLTLQELERWTNSHPRHLAILASIGAYMEQFNFQSRLNLGHEVVVAPKGCVYAEYNNCHPNTGFLPFFPAQARG